MATVIIKDYLYRKIACIQHGKLKRFIFLIILFERLIVDVFITRITVKESQLKGLNHQIMFIFIYFLKVPYSIRLYYIMV